MTGVYICPAVSSVRKLYEPLLGPARSTRPIREQFADEADVLHNAHVEGDATVEFQISSWHPDWIGQKGSDILAGDFTAGDARLTIAREYGYSDWNAVEALGAEAPDGTFEALVDAALAGEVDVVESELAARPALANQRSTFAHRAGLAHYLAANGVETWRQVVPLNADAVLKALVDNGADMNAAAPIYGGSRPLGLLLTSAHPKDAGLDARMAAVMRAAGAN